MADRLEWRWENLSTLDFRTLRNRLLAAECPERTIRAILEIMIDREYRPRLMDLFGQIQGNFWDQHVVAKTGLSSKALIICSSCTPPAAVPQIKVWSRRTKSLSQPRECRLLESAQEFSLLRLVQVSTAPDGLRLLFGGLSWLATQGVFAFRET